MKITFALLGAERLERSLGSAQQLLVRDLRAHVRNTAEIVKEAAQANAPVFTGTLASRIRIRMARNGFSATVKAAAPHAWIIGRGGRKPGKMPPPDKLAIWAIAKGLKGKEFVIARAIARKGIKPKRFLTIAWRNQRPLFLQGVHALLDRFARALN